MTTEGLNSPTFECITMLHNSDFWHRGLLMTSTLHGSTLKREINEEMSTYLLYKWDKKSIQIATDNPLTLHTIQRRAPLPQNPFMEKQIATNDLSE